jgi:hypothetical protein
MSVRSIFERPVPFDLAADGAGFGVDEAKERWAAGSNCRPGTSPRRAEMVTALPPLG